MTDFSEITSKDDFFKLLNIPKRNMTYLLYNKQDKGTENSYNTFEIPKKSGGVRTIHAPNDELKFVQKRLASLLWRTQKKIWTERAVAKNKSSASLKINQKNVAPNISHAFEENKSIITNAKIHRNKKYVLNVDLANFFDSFHFGRVKGFFEKDRDFKVPVDVALVISQIVCYKGVLPQGAPTSPIITNMICRILDLRILKLAKKYRLDYTRYADDLTFSTNVKNFSDKYNAFLQELENEITRGGFKINSKKTRLQFDSSRQEVTGLVVNKKINVQRKYFKDTKAMAFNLYSSGAFFINGEEVSINKLEGRFTFINQLVKYNNLLEYSHSLNKNNIEYKKNLLPMQLKKNNSHKVLEHMNSREREYQKFLFYKYFYGNELPIVVTEGKTDVRYLKAALKKLYKNYPTLIEKSGDKFNFKIRFLKKSKRLAYFFNLPVDGADGMKNLFNFFSDKDSRHYKNYLDYFKNLNSSEPKCVTIFLFDNEISNPNKPLKNFFNYVYNGRKDKAESEKILKEELSLEIAEKLYIFTNPLIENDKENELEDLFDKVVLSKVIGGKSFSKNGDSNSTYGKEIFSKYVLNNYHNIEFENFRSILDNIVDVI